MKRFSKCICIVLAAVILMTTPAFAAEAMERSSSFFWGSSVFLWKTSDNTFEVWFDVSAIGTMDKLGASVIKVQRSSDGENWTTMRTYTKEVYTDLICENTGSHAACVSYTGTVGYYYRAYVLLYAKNSSGVGEIPEYTATLKL